ncbi:MAG: S8 family serine peptidase [Gammaproteobacteria bacterium]|nr:S8 family serine peptidase [Gammaproteobacteria bacterium]
MKSRLWQPTLLALGVLAASTATAGQLINMNQAGVIPGRYIVVFKAERLSAKNLSTDRAANALARGHGARVAHVFKKVLNGAVLEMSLDQAAELAADPSVAYVEPEIRMYAWATQSGATWGIDRSDQRSLPLDSSYTYATTASNVHAYIVDTGIRATHNEFSGRMGNGYDAIKDGNGTNDCQGHGSHVAGTVGGTTYGLAKGVTLHAVRVLDCQGSGTNTGVVEGMDWVASNHVKPAVANMSLGGGASQSIDDAVARMTNAGVTVVVAAGNDSSNACNYSPARAPSAITVGSTTSSDGMSSFSNYGSCVDIFAPGSSITSVGISSNTATASMSGTSMASPHVAGGAALYLATNSTATPSAVTTALVNAASSDKISGIPSGPNKLLYTGDGSDTPPPPPPGDVVLSNGVAQTSQSGATGSWKYYTLSVPAGASNLKFVTSGGSGDADLFVRFGSKPTSGSYDCKSEGSTNSETCNIATAQAGTYYVGVYGYAAFSGMSLTGSYTTGGGGGGDSGENTTDVAIPDNNSTGVTSSISIGSSGTASSVSVDVNIVHTYIGDLVVDLLSPNGTVFNLHNRSGGSADNIVKTYSVNTGGVARTGTWKLRVKDRAAIDTGYINSWKLTINN